MKRLLLIAFLMIPLLMPSLSWGQEKAKVTKISGQISGNQIYTEISLRPPTRDVSVVATSAIQADGKFYMEFTQLETNLFRLFLADNNFLLLILQPGENVSLKLDAANIAMNPQQTGSEETAIYWNFGQIFNFLSAGIDSVENAWKENQKNQASEEVFNALRTRYTFFDEQRNQSVVEFIKANPSSLAGLVYLERLDMSNFFETYDLYDREMMKKHAKNPYFQELHKKIEAERHLAVGNIAPDIVLPNPKGEVKSLSALRGKVVLIDFWAAWCGPCRKENPHVVELYNKYNSKGFEVFGVSLDKDADAWVKAIEKDGLVWTQVSDLKYWKSEAAKLYGVGAIPFTVLIDRDGKIIAKKLRGEDLSKKLEEIFGF